MNAYSLLGLVVLAGSSTAQVPSQINIELDYMETPGHSHRPSQDVIDAVVQMFACHNITLSILVDNAIPEVPIIKCPDPGEDSFFTCSGSLSFSELKDEHAFFGALPGWHYAIFGHDYDDGEGTGSSGIAEIDGNDFLVSLGSFGLTGTEFEQAATLVHELGHNLGLRHSSPSTFLPSGPWSPQYASTMSYQYQLSGIRTRMECLGLAPPDNLLKEIDYSNGLLPNLAESVLYETVGAGMQTTDWNCNGVIDGAPVTKDLDFDEEFCSQGQGLSLHDDWNDWANIVDSTDSPSVFTDSTPLDVERCMTLRDRDALRGIFDPSLFPDGPPPDPTACWSGGPSQPQLTVESCRLGRMIWVDEAHSGTGIAGTGSDPYRSISTAVGVAPAGSCLYLQDGSFTNFGNSLVIDHPMVLLGPGTAVIDP